MQYKAKGPQLRQRRERKREIEIEMETTKVGRNDQKKSTKLSESTNLETQWSRALGEREVTSRIKENKITSQKK